MWWFSLLGHDENDGGEAVIFGEGRAGATYSWKGLQLGEKRLYISPLRGGGPTLRPVSPTGWKRGRRLNSLPLRGVGSTHQGVVPLRDGVEPGANLKNQVG